MNARLPWVLLFCVGIVLTVHSGIGQTAQVVVFSPAAQAPPPASPPPGGPAKPVIPPPPLPMGTPIEELPRFEVDSVKKFEGRVTSTALRTPGGGRITIIALPLRTVIVQAFGGLRDYQMSGGPAWLTSDRFTINAKAETNAPRDQLMLMLRRLLVERFQFKFHVEKREMQAYVLTTAEEPWKPTARMKPMDCAGKKESLPTSGVIRADNMPCGMTMMGTNGVQARGVTMTQFVSTLASLGQLGVVHDRTGLTGTYTIELDATPASLARALSLAGLSGTSTADNLMPSLGEGRALGSAVRDLGLKLERQKEMVDVLVIDSVSQPDED